MGKTEMNDYYFQRTADYLFRRIGNAIRDKSGFL